MTPARTQAAKAEADARTAEAERSLDQAAQLFGAFGVGQWGTEGSRLLHAASSETGAEALRGRTPSEEELARRVATRRAGVGYVMPDRWAEDGWKPEEIALVGTIPDAELAKRIGRSRAAVRAMRGRLGISAAPS